MGHVISCTNARIIAKILFQVMGYSGAYGGVIRIIFLISIILGVRLFRAIHSVHHLGKMERRGFSRIQGIFLRFL